MLKVYMMRPVQKHDCILYKLQWFIPYLMLAALML